jgi:hypothetical protein
MKEEREWTVMFYLACDNPLAPGTITHLKAIKNAGYHPEVNVIAQFDPHTTNMPVHIFDVNRIEKMKHPNKANIGFAGDDPFVRNLVTDKLWPSDLNQRIRRAMKGRLDFKFEPPVPSKEMMNDGLTPKDSLEKFLQFCRRNYPARHYMLFIVGHGEIVGNDVFMHDEHVTPTRNGNAKPSSLSLIDLAGILDRFKTSLRRAKRGPLELIGFHACSMSGAEVAFQLKGKANYMLAAQGPTYNGAWPYRQILIRLFNDLNSGGRFTKEGLGADGLVDTLKRGRDSFSKFLRRRCNGNGMQELLDEHVIGERPAPRLAQALAHEFNGMLTDAKLPQQFPHVKLPTIPNLQANELGRQHRNWHLLQSVLPPEVAQANTRVNVKRLCKKIFDYCLFNSFDFQLAGYSCDLTLVDLNKVDVIEEPIANLVKSLKRGLKSSKTYNHFLIRALMLLAHWESQSFFQEQYTDLYDFCFRLRAKCEKARIHCSPSHNTLKRMADIEATCKAVMTALKKGHGEDDDGVIVRCEFVGPAYQYVHGLSVFFPWAEPVANPMWEKQYPKFAFNKVGWQSFLKLYFGETMRKPAGDEKNDVEPNSAPDTLDTNLLNLLQRMARQVFNDDGQLGTAGSKDPLGTAGSRDPQGDDCDCPSIKNYPSITHTDKQRIMVTNKQVINMFRQFGKEFPHQRRS